MSPLVRLNIALTWHRPAGTAALTVAAAYGAWSAATPAGFDGLGHGLGLLGGLSQGVGAALGILPAILVGTIVGLVGEPPPPHVGEAQDLSGQDPALRRRAGIVAAFVVSVMASSVAVPAALVVAVGDSIRQGSGWFSSPPHQIGVVGVVGAFLVAVQAAGLVMVVRRRGVALALVFVLAGVFLVAMSSYAVSGSGTAHAIAGITPFGPAWSRAAGGDAILALPMSTGNQVLVTAGWTVLATIGLVATRGRWLSHASGASVPCRAV
ncbi:MAG: hypothetical protein ACRDPG_11785 [Nocardioidaceae bacterium]